VPILLELILSELILSELILSERILAVLMLAPCTYPLKRMFEGLSYALY
jgi:hypothetical protein